MEARLFNRWRNVQHKKEWDNRSVFFGVSCSGEISISSPSKSVCPAFPAIARHSVPSAHSLASDVSNKTNSGLAAFVPRGRVLSANIECDGLARFRPLGGTFLPLWRNRARPSHSIFAPTKHSGSRAGQRLPAEFVLLLTSEANEWALTRNRMPGYCRKSISRAYTLTWRGNGNFPARTDAPKKTLRLSTPSCVAHSATD